MCQYLAHQICDILYASKTVMKLIFFRAEPPKRKKKADGAMLQMKENRRRRKLEKELIKLERSGRILKPLPEKELSRTFMKSIP